MIVQFLKAVLIGSFLFHSALQAQDSGKLAPILSISAYEDQDIGFSMAVPTGWLKISALATEDANLESGYTIGFESPKSGEQDIFADYVMVEILPGNYSGAFQTDGEKRREVLVDGQVAIVDELVIENFNINGATLDLMVYQAQIQMAGFNIGLYVIGEHKEEAVLSDAFKLLLHTYSLPINPFDVS